MKFLLPILIFFVCSCKINQKEEETSINDWILNNTFPKNIPNSVIKQNLNTDIDSVNYNVLYKKKGNYLFVYIPKDLEYFFCGLIDLRDTSFIFTKDLNDTKSWNNENFDFISYTNNQFLFESGTSSSWRTLEIYDKQGKCLLKDSYYSGQDKNLEFENDKLYYYSVISNSQLSDSLNQIKHKENLNAWVQLAKFKDGRKYQLNDFKEVYEE